MIFVTVGTQLPFTRLIDAMDEIAGRLDEEIIAQTGPGEGNWSNLDCRKNLEPEEFGKLFSAARVIVAHAGIGTILSARSRRKPLILLPRRFSFGEHRNDHQMATAGQVKSPPRHLYCRECREPGAADPARGSGTGQRGREPRTHGADFPVEGDHRLMMKLAG